MASIPLPALAIQQPADPVTKYMQMRAQLQGMQVQQAQLTGLQQENQQRQIALQDEQTIRQIAPAHVLKDQDGNVTGYDFAGLAQHALQAGVNPRTVQAMQVSNADVTQKLSAATKEQLSAQDTISQKLFDHLEDVRSVTNPASRQSAYLNAVHAINKWGPQLGLDPRVLQLPPSAPDDNGITEMEATLGMHKQILSDAKSRADTNKANAEAASATATAQKTQQETAWYQGQGLAPGVSPETAAMADWLKKNPGKGPADYEIAKQTDPRLIQARTQQAVGTEIATQKALAPALQQITSTTRAGRQYINREDVPQKSAGYVEQQAAQAGVPIVDKDVAGTLSEIDTAKANQEYMLNAISKKLASDPTGRLYTAPANTIAKLSQTDPDLAAMGTFRNAAIQSMRAVAGSKGLRINQYEVQLAIDNDIPKMTDTLPVAKQKIANLQAFLDNSESAHLIRNRQVGGAAAAGGPAKGYTRIQASDGSLHDIPAGKLAAARQRDPNLKVMQ